MLDWTDRFCRYFLRLLSRRTLLYTEMVTTGALIHGDTEHHLRFDPLEHPLALQLGGSEPGDLAECARLGARWGYDEINLNVGCPSDRVQSGSFGACLMATPEVVADGVKAMRDAVDLPVTVKHRIGIDDRDSYEELVDFVGQVAEAGCEVFIVHARKAWLKGLNPKQNREIPPLNYDVVARLKQDFPDLQIVINGGISSLTQTEELLRTFDGVMIGRAAYQNPEMLAEADQRIYQEAGAPMDAHQALENYLPFVERQLAEGVYLGHMSRHLMGLFQGRPGARAWRRHLSENAHKPGANADVLRRAAERVQNAPAQT